MQAGRVGEKKTSKYNRNGLAAALLKYRRFKTMISKNGNNEIKTLSHSTYRCQYHIVFAPKYRRKVFYEEHRQEVREILRKLCEREERKSDTRICSKSAKDGQRSRPVEHL